MNQRAFATIVQVRRHVLKALGAVYIQRLIIQHRAEIDPNTVFKFTFGGMLTEFFSDLSDKFITRHLRARQAKNSATGRQMLIAKQAVQRRV